MWIASTLGFFSIVAKKAGEFQIRAREQRDLENAKVACLDIRYAKIVETPQSDYRYRLVVTKAQAVAFVTEAAQRIDYANFKNAVHQIEGQEHKGGAYMTIWSAMGRLQPGGPYGNDTRFEPVRHAEALLDYAEGWRPAKRTGNYPKTPRRTWRAGCTDGLLHLVPNASRRSRDDFYVGKMGYAACGAESGDWMVPVPANAKDCPKCCKLQNEGTRMAKARTLE